MKTLKRYLITLGVGFLAVFLIAVLRDIFSKVEPVEIYHILVDAFFSVGVLMFCGGLLVFSSNEGTFDMLVYGTSSFFDLFRKKSKKKYATFYDYRESRAGKKLKFGYIVISGLVLLAISGVMYWLYCIHGG